MSRGPKDTAIWATLKVSPVDPKYLYFLSLYSFGKIQRLS